MLLGCPPGALFSHPATAARPTIRGYRNAMNEPTTKEIKESLAKITPEQWAVSRFVTGCGCRTITLRDHLDRPFGFSVDDEACLRTYQKSIATIGHCRLWFAEGEAEANATFIAAAPHYVRFLLEKVAGLEARLTNNAIP